MERTRPTQLRRAALGIAVLLVPGALLIAWAAIVFGGGVDALREQEQRDARAAFAAAAAAVEATLRGMADDNAAGQVRIERGADGSSTGPFLPFELTALEPEPPDPLAVRVALELEARGDTEEALRWARQALEVESVALLPRARFLHARLLARHGEQDAALRELAQLRADSGEATTGGMPVATLATVLELSIAAAAGDHERASQARTALVAGHVPCPLPAVDAIAARIRRHTPPPYDDLDDWLRAARVASSVAMLPEDALVRGPDGSVLRSTRNSVVVLAPRDVTRAIEAARAELERAHPDWTIATGAEDALVSDTPAFLTRPLSIAPTATLGSARLQVSARALAFAALAAFLLGNFLLLRTVRRELRLSRLRSSFIDLVSHELRTPLTALTVKAEMLAEGDVPAAKVAAYQRDVLGAARRLGDLVQRVLDFARLEKARLPLEPHTVSVRQLLASAVRAGRDALRLGGQRLEVRAPRELPSVRVDVEVMARADPEPARQRRPLRPGREHGGAPRRHRRTAAAHRGRRPGSRTAGGAGRGAVRAVPTRAGGVGRRQRTRARDRPPGCPCTPWRGQGARPRGRCRCGVRGLAADRGGRGVRRLLVVEDEPDIREALVDFFGGRQWGVAEAATVAEAERHLATSDFDAVLLDLRLPDGDGLEVLRALRARGDDTPVLVVTAHGAEEQRIAGLEIGADDYVVKPFSVRELAARVDAIVRRTTGATAVRRIGDAEIDFGTREVRRAGSTTRLLQKELELLEYLLRHPRRPIPRDELLREVWGYDSFPSTRTVDTHVFNLRKKIEPTPDDPQHLRTVHGVGYMLVLDPPG